MTEQLEGQGNLFDLDTWCGRTYQEHLVPTRVKTSKPHSKRSSTLSKKHPICLCLMGGGPNRDVSTMSWEVGALLGEYTMHSFGEYPKEERDSHLSQILEEEAHPKYFLSEKACRGILRRAKEKGKALPEELEEALTQQVELSQKETESA